MPEENDEGTRRPIRFEPLPDRLYWQLYPGLVLSLGLFVWDIPRSFRALPDPGAVFMLIVESAGALLFGVLLAQNALNIKIFPNTLLRDIGATIGAGFVVVMALGACCLPLFPSEYLSGDNACGKPLSTIVAEWLKGDIVTRGK